MGNRITIDFGVCGCGSNLKPSYYEEEEYEMNQGVRIPTGRKRRAVANLVCPSCLRTFIVDDSFDGEWY